MSSSFPSATATPRGLLRLVVRVSGYSAYFADPEQVVQNDIIAWMEHAL